MNSGISFFEDREKNEQKIQYTHSHRKKYMQVYISGSKTVDVSKADEFKASPDDGRKNLVGQQPGLYSLVRKLQLLINKGDINC